LNEITLYKTAPEEISQESWDKWNSYMIHRYVSMNIGYIDIVNYVQKINPQNKKQIYSIYREMLPKKKVYLKYVKNQNKKNYQELAEYVADYYECSLGEADYYIDILGISVRSILWKMGVEEDETEKLIKKALL
jgi:hypothetical protein|tara:strand:+ start:495 stop:896 length:402 start_codon:yes stop_codon:yes gene_type:complete